MGIPSDLKPILLSLKNGLPSTQNLARLVFICRTIAESLLRIYHRQSAEILFQHGWSLHDLSLDCLGELFARDAEGSLLKFDAFLRELARPASQFSDLALFLALKGYINRFVAFRLMKLLTEVDPEGRRISRNLREAVRRNGARLRITRDPRGDSLTAKGADAIHGLPEFPLHIFEQSLFGNIRAAMSINEIVKVIAAILSEQKSYRRSIRFIDAVQVIKRIYADRFFHERSGEDGGAEIRLDGAQEADIQVLRSGAIRFVAQKIDATYLRKKKVTEKEAFGLLMTVTDVLDNWLNGVNTDHDYYSHAKERIGCTEDQYAERWAARVHYLVKSLRIYVSDQQEWPWR